MAVETAARRGIAAAMGEAGLAALVALALAGPLIGLHAVSLPTGLVIQARWVALAAAVALVFLGRLGLVAIRAGWLWPAAVGGTGVAAAGWFASMPAKLVAVIAVAGGLLVAGRAAYGLLRRARLPAGAAATGAAPVRPAAPSRRATLAIGIALTVGAIPLPLLPFADRRLLDLATLVIAYVILGWGLNIVVGLAGLLDLGYVAFYAVGAYSFALLSLNFGLSFWECLPLAGAFAAMFGILLGFPVLRLRGDYLAIVTLGFGEMIRIVLINWVSVTKGPNGISGIPRPTFFGLPFTPNPPDGTTAFHQLFGLDYSPLQRVIFLYYVVLGLALVTNLFVLRMRRLPAGRAWEAMREDEIACRSLGINPTNVKLSAFALGAMFGGFSGAVFAARQNFISPESFTFIESAIILAIVVLGGMGSQIGVIAAAVLLIGVPEWFRELQEYRMLAFGGAMVLIMAWRPRGLLATREPTIRLRAAGTGRAP
jgi:branched-chain amino acid transport system permease protein